MIIKLNDYLLANGTSRVGAILGRNSLSLTQETQVTVRARALWPTAFYSRAVRKINRVYEVTCAPCASLEEAKVQAITFPLDCPRGGVLTEQTGTRLITYADAWIDGAIVCEPLGLTNRFTVPVTAINPTIQTLSRLAAMDPNNVINLSDIETLLGGGATALQALDTADVSVGMVVLVTVLLGTAPNAYRQTKFMRLIADPDPGVTTSQDDPQLGALCVVPEDYDAVTNAKIWSEIL